MIRPGRPGEFDNYVALICGTHQHSDGKLYAFYHAGDTEGMPWWYDIFPGVYSSIGVAVSTDNGRHFTKLGPVLTSMLPKDPASTNQFQGIGECTVAPDPTGQYLLLYYTEHSLIGDRGSTNRRRSSGSFARASNAGSLPEVRWHGIQPTGIGRVRRSHRLAPPGAGHAINPSVSYSSPSAGM